MSKEPKRTYEYEVALSFAGEERSFVEGVANILKQNQIDVFYDRFEEVHMWGKDLIDLFDEVYGSNSKYVVMFISKNYAEKMWTNFERQTTLSRLIKEGKEYLLPARFDDTVLAGVRGTIAYIDLRRETEESFASKLIQKIAGIVPKDIKSTTLSKAGKNHEGIASPEPIGVYASELPLFLYSVNAWLNYQICQNYYNATHYAWCSPSFRRSGITSPSANPHDIYRELSKAVEQRDQESARIAQSRIGILKGAMKKCDAKIISKETLKEIQAIVNVAEASDFRPLLYIIPYNLVSNTIKQVPVKERIHPLDIEYLIENLPRDIFDVIEF